MKAIPEACWDPFISMRNPEMPFLSHKLVAPGQLSMEFTLKTDLAMITRPYDTMATL